MNQTVANVIQYCNKDRLIVDSNLLILLLIGNFDKNRISKFKRTNMFTVEDYDLLVNIIKKFNEIIVTPNILTEVCNLCNSYNTANDNKLYIYFKQIIDNFTENYVPTKSITTLFTFNKLGVSDSTIFELCSKGTLLLTDDFPLYSCVTSKKYLAINFHNLRKFN